MSRHGAKEKIVMSRNTRLCVFHVTQNLLLFLHSAGAWLTVSCTDHCTPIHSLYQLSKDRIHRRLVALASGQSTAEAPVDDVDVFYLILAWRVVTVDNQSAVSTRCGFFVFDSLCVT